MADSIKRCPECSVGFWSGLSYTDKDFCVDCGTELDSFADELLMIERCPECEEEVFDSWEFCGYCGTDLESAIDERIDELLGV